MFQYYKAGMIYFDANHPNRSVNHRVTAVCYGAENCRECWIIWNSRGTSSDDTDYFLLATNKNSICRIWCDSTITTYVSQ